MNMIDLAKDAFLLWWPGTTLVIIVLVYQFVKLWSGDTTIKKHLSKTFVALFAYTVFCLAVTLAKQHVLESSHLLALALTALAAISFFTALYFERLRIVFRTAGIILAVSAATASYANWLPQAKGGYPTPEVKLTVDQMTPQQLADEGEKIIFGGIGQSMAQERLGGGNVPFVIPSSPNRRANGPQIFGESLPESAFTTPRLNTSLNHMSAQAATLLADLE